MGNSLEFIDIPPGFKSEPSDQNHVGVLAKRWDSENPAGGYEFMGKNFMITGYDGACQIVSDGNSAKITTFVSQKNIIDNDLK